MLGARLPRLHLVLPGLRKLLEGAASPVCIPRRELSPGSVIGIDAMKVMLDYVKIPKNSTSLLLGQSIAAEKHLYVFINSLQQHGLKCVFVFSGRPLPNTSQAGGGFVKRKPIQAESHTAQRRRRRPATASAASLQSTSIGTDNSPMQRARPQSSYRGSNTRSSNRARGSSRPVTAVASGHRNRSARRRGKSAHGRSRGRQGIPERSLSPLSLGGPRAGRKSMRRRKISSPSSSSLNGGASGFHMDSGQITASAADLQQIFVSILSAAGIPYIVAPYEAAAQLAFMDASGLLDYVLSDNSNCLPFGCSQVLMDYDFCKGTAVLYRQDIMKTVTPKTESAPLLRCIRNFGFDALPVFCALLVNNFGPKKAMKALIQQWHLKVIHLDVLVKRNCIDRESEKTVKGIYELYKNEIVYDFKLKACRPLSMAVKFPDSTDRDERVPIGCGKPVDGILLEQLSNLHPNHFVLFPEITHTHEKEAGRGGGVESERRNLKRYITMQKVYNERMSSIV